MFKSAIYNRLNIKLGRKRRTVGGENVEQLNV
jgi:hypothetical protein